MSGVEKGEATVELTFCCRKWRHFWFKTSTNSLSKSWSLYHAPPVNDSSGVRSYNMYTLRLDACTDLTLFYQFLAFKSFKNFTDLSVRKVWTYSDVSYPYSLVAAVLHNLVYKLLFSFKSFRLTIRKGSAVRIFRMMSIYTVRTLQYESWGCITLVLYVDCTDRLTILKAKSGST